MTSNDTASWLDRLQRTLSRYDEALLRQVAAKLVKPRNQWPVEDLIERSVETASNPAVLDRRIKELESASRLILSLIGHSRQTRWQLGNLVELAVALGNPDGLPPVLALLEEGLLYPLLPDDNSRIKSFEQWVATTAAQGPTVFTLPIIASRALGQDFGLPDLTYVPDGDEDAKATSALRMRGLAAQEADGLEWLLRLSVLWQQTFAAPLRRTMQGGFFKRDADRIAQDPILNSPPADQIAEVPDLGFLIAAWAELQGILIGEEAELRVGPLPTTWEAGLGPALESLWADLFQLRMWNPLDGWRGGQENAGNPFPSAYLLAFLLLGKLPPDASAQATDLEIWLLEQHPYWSSEGLRPSRQKPWLETFLLGVAYPLRVVQAARDGENWLIRLSPTGRWLLGLSDVPPAETAYARTLLVQPNLEILAYRQGLSASLIARLSTFADWKALGAACTLQLGPETVYRGLESGQSFDGLCRCLEQHGTRTIPPAVLEALRTWANKRDRITVYPAAMLLEFLTPADLNEALSRGVPIARLSDTLAVAAGEGAIEFRHFRLSGTRDYGLQPERCVTVESDGVTLTVDLTRSDLLLETELPGFAEPLPGTPQNGRRQYRLTPASLAGARESGWQLTTLEKWFEQRCGQFLPAPVRLLLTGAQMPPPVLKRHLVLHVDAEESADGIVTWPETASLIAERLGPTALAVTEENLPLLRERLALAGIRIDEHV